MGIGLALGLVAIFIAGVMASPSITETKEERARVEAAERAAHLARERARVAREQRPVSAIAGPAPRAALEDKLAGYVLRDARARIEAGTLKGTARRSFCELRPPRATAARGRYMCTVVTSEIVGPNGQRGNLGYPFSAVIDYRSGRMTWCKANLPPGEKVIGAEQLRVDLHPSCSKP